MSENIEQKINCGNCEEPLPVAWISSSSRKVCPKCGSSKKIVSVNIVENLSLKIHESLNGKINDSNFNSKRNPRYQFFQGDDIRKNDGKWMKKSRVIDKYANRYTEKVTDPETGEVVHNCDESLTDHFGHGNAKLKKDKKV